MQLGFASFVSLRREGVTTFPSCIIATLQGNIQMGSILIKKLNLIKCLGFCRAAALSLLLFALGSFEAKGQKASSDSSYTFQSDQAFYHPGDLRGITFHPQEHRSCGDNSNAAPGEISITFKQIELVITGVPELDSSYYLADIQKSKEGFIAEILDRDHPSVPFSLVIQTDEESFVKRFTLHTLDDGRHDFILPDRPAVDRARLDSTFTNREEFNLELYDSTFSFTFVPFLYEAHIVLQSGIEILDGSVNFIFTGDSVIFNGPEETKEFEIRNIEHDASGEPGLAGTRYRIGLDLRTGGKKGEKVFIALFFDTWHDLEYIVWGPSRYYPRP